MPLTALLDRKGEHAAFSQSVKESHRDGAGRQPPAIGAGWCSDRRPGPWSAAAGGFRRSLARACTGAGHLALVLFLGVGEVSRAPVDAALGQA